MNYSEIRNRIKTGCTYIPKLLVTAIETLDFRITAKTNVLTEKIESLEKQNKELTDYVNYLHRELNETVGQVVTSCEKITNYEKENKEMLACIKRLSEGFVRTAKIVENQDIRIDQLENKPVDLISKQNVWADVFMRV